MIDVYDKVDFDYLDSLAEYSYCSECNEVTWHTPHIYLYSLTEEEIEDGDFYGVTCKQCYLKECQ